MIRRALSVLTIGVASGGALYTAQQSRRSHIALAQQQPSSTTKTFVTPPSDSNVSKPLSVEDASVAAQAAGTTVKYVIVGGGIAALNAVKAIRELDPNGKILVLDSASSTPIERPLLNKQLLWHGLNDESDPTALRLPHETENRSISLDLPSNDANLTWRTGATVSDLDPDAKAVLVGGNNDDPNSGEVVFFDKCLLATGSTARRVREFVGGRLVQDWDESPFDSTSAVTAYRSLEDFVRLRSAMTSAKHVAVIGGGASAAELAVGLRRAFPNVRVSMLFKEPLLLSDIAPSDVAQKVTTEVQRHGVELHPETHVQVLDRSRPGRPVAIFTNDESQAPIEADHVVVAIGEKPATKFAELAQLELDDKTGGIVVNSELAARSDIYVAGDVACYYDPKLSRRTRTTSYDHAVMSGRAAGRNMTGKREVYAHTPMFWSQIGDLSIETVGRTDPSLQTVGVWDQVGRETPNDASKAHGVVYYIDENRIVGVLLCNVDAQIDNARAVVQRRKLYYDKKILMSLISIERGTPQ